MEDIVSASSFKQEASTQDQDQKPIEIKDSEVKLKYDSSDMDRFGAV
jgi:hypothetical protein